MESAELQTKARYEQRWQKAIAKGTEQAGNLELNLAFLDQTGLLRPNKTILELGCGMGQLTAALHQKGLNITGSDISQTAIDFAAGKYPDIRWRVLGAERLPFEDECFDLVLSFDVLEHLHDVDCHLQDVRRILKPDGCYLLQTPNKLSNIIFETLKHRSLYWRTFHPSLQSYRHLRRRLRGHGFFPQFVKMNTMNAYTLKKLKTIGLPQAAVRWIDFRRLPLRMQTNFYVIAERAPRVPDR